MSLNEVELVKLEQIEKELEKINPVIQAKIDRVKEIKIDIADEKEDTSSQDKAVRREAKARMGALKVEWDKIDREKNRLKSDRCLLWAEQSELMRKADDEQLSAIQKRRSEALEKKKAEANE